MDVSTERTDTEGRARDHDVVGEVETWQQIVASVSHHSVRCLKQSPWQNFKARIEDDVRGMVALRVPPADSALLIRSNS